MPSTTSTPTTMGSFLLNTQAGMICRMHGNTASSRAASCSCGQRAAGQVLSGGGNRSGNRRRQQGKEQAAAGQEVRRRQEVRRWQQGRKHAVAAGQRYQRTAPPPPSSIPAAAMLRPFLGTLMLLLRLLLLLLLKGYPTHVLNAPMRDPKWRCHSHQRCVTPTANSPDISYPQCPRIHTCALIVFMYSVNWSNRW